VKSKPQSNISGLVENWKQYISVLIIIYRIITLNAHKTNRSTAIPETHTVTASQFKINSVMLGCQMKHYNNYSNSSSSKSHSDILSKLKAACTF